MSELLSNMKLDFSVAYEQVFKSKGFVGGLWDLG